MRAAAKTTSLPVYQQISLDLQRLGHVEFWSNEQSRRLWRVVPPALALLPNHRDEGLLCGARSPELLQRLDHLDGIEVSRVERADMPLRIAIRGEPIELAVAAATLRCLVQVDAAKAMLSGLPTVRDRATWRRVEIPRTSGWSVDRFSSTELRWVETSARDAAKATSGLFRFVMKHQRLYFLKWKARSFEIPGAVGKYVVRRQRRGILAYDAASRVFSVPAILRPPLLVERALVLCSGFLPIHDPESRRVRYGGVPSDVARLAAQILRQEVQ